MELQTQDGYILISLEEYKAIKRFMDGFIKFRPVYAVYNRKLNAEFKLIDALTIPKIKEIR